MDRASTMLFRTAEIPLTEMSTVAIFSDRFTSIPDVHALATTVRNGEGFRTTASGAGRARHGEAGVRKPPKEETAFRKRRWGRSCDLWGFEDRRLSAPRS